MDYESFYNNKKSLGLILSSISVLIFLLVMVMTFLKPGILFDDYYTLGIVRFPLMEMIGATAENVHPPLYYIILKIFFKIFNPVDNFSMILIGKLVSLIPLGLLLIISFTKVKKEFGILTAGVFSFLLISSFNVIHYATFIRMYTWALLFITIELLSFYDIIHRKSNLYAWIFFTIASICAIYTHYFAAISSIIIYLILFAYLFYYNKRDLKKWFISAFVSIIFYLPWIGILISQFAAVSDHYWIQPIRFETFLYYFDFIFFVSDGPIARISELKIFEVLLIVLLLVVIYISLKNKKLRDDYVDFSLISISLVFFTMITGIALSFLIRPIFVPRYMLPCLGGLWLGFAILLEKCFDYNKSKTSFAFDTRKIFYFGVILIFIISVFSTVNFIYDIEDYYNETLDDFQFFDSINDGRIVIFDTPLSYLRYSVFFDNNKCILDKKLKDVDKYKGRNTVMFVKMHNDNLNDNFDVEEIFDIHLDKVYLLK